MHSAAAGELQQPFQGVPRALLERTFGPGGPLPRPWEVRSAASATVIQSVARACIHARLSYM